MEDDVFLSGSEDGFHGVGHVHLARESVHALVVLDEGFAVGELPVVFSGEDVVVIYCGACIEVINLVVAVGVGTSACDGCPCQFRPSYGGACRHVHLELSECHACPSGGCVVVVVFSFAVHAVLTCVAAPGCAGGVDELWFRCGFCGFHFHDGSFSESAHAVGAADAELITFCGFNFIAAFILHNGHKLSVLEDGVGDGAFHGCPTENAVGIRGFRSGFLNGEAGRVPCVGVLAEHLLIAVGGCRFGCEDGLEGASVRGDDVGRWGDVVAGLVLGSIFSKHLRVFVVHTLLSPARFHQCGFGIGVEDGVEVNANRLVLPGASEVPGTLSGCEIDNLASVEHIAESGAGGRCGDGALSCAVLIAGLEREGGVLEADVAGSTDEIYCAVDVAVFPIGLFGVLAVVGVLIGQHAHVLEDIAVALVLEAYAASGRGGSIVIKLVLECEVLHVEILAGVEQHGCGSDAFVLFVWGILDNHAFGRLSDDGDVVSADRGECGLLEVVGAVWNKHESAFCALGCVDAVHGVEHVEQTAGITCFHHKPVSVLLVVGLGGVHDFQVVEIDSAGGTDFHGERAGCSFVVEGGGFSVVLCHCLDAAHFLTVFLEHECGASLRVFTQTYEDGGVAANEKVNLVAVGEYPSVLCVMPFATACRNERLVVFGIEGVAAEIELIFLRSALHLDFRGYGIELGVFRDDVAGGELAAWVVLYEPSTHLLSFWADGGGEIYRKFLDAGIFLYGLGVHLAAVGVDVGECEVWFLHETDDVVDGDACHTHWNGGGAFCLIA